MERKRTRNSSKPAAVYQLSARRSGCDVPRGRAQGSQRRRYLSATPAGRSRGSPRLRSDVQPNENRVLSKLLRKKYSNNIGKLEYDLHKHRVDAPKYSYQALK